MDTTNELCEDTVDTVGATSRLELLGTFTWAEAGLTNSLMIETDGFGRIDSK